jgi:hypothetical protein
MGHNDHNDYVDRLVESGWEVGEPGKGLLLRGSDGFVLLTWRTLMMQGPHHGQVLALRGLNEVQVVGRFDIYPDGSTQSLGGYGTTSDFDAVAIAVSMDPRLSPREDRARWDFS